MTLSASLSKLEKGVLQSISRILSPFLREESLNGRGGLVSSSHMDSKFHVAVACSGGSDSLFLTLMLHNWCLQNCVSLTAMIVDHGLRVESKEEAHRVSSFLLSRGVSAEVLTLKKDDFPPCGSLQERARLARYSILKKRCAGLNIHHIFLGHHLQDQVETFFMRLKNKSGLSGLCSMMDCLNSDGFLLCRPMLDIDKRDIVSYLESHNIAYIKDPSNEKDVFERVRVRRLLTLLDDQSDDFSFASIGGSIKKLQQVDDALKYYANLFLEKVVYKEPGYVLFLHRDFLPLPYAIKEKVLVTILCSFVGGYPPKSRKLKRLITFLSYHEGSHTQVGGCSFFFHKGNICICRAWASVEPMVLEKGEFIWDDRYRISTSVPLEVCPLGWLNKKILDEGSKGNCDPDGNKVCGTELYRKREDVLQKGEEPCLDERKEGQEEGQEEGREGASITSSSLSFPQVPLQGSAEQTSVDPFLINPTPEKGSFSDHIPAKDHISKDHILEDHCSKEHLSIDHFSEGHYLGEHISVDADCSFEGGCLSGYSLAERLSLKDVFTKNILEGNVPDKKNSTQKSLTREPLTQKSLTQTLSIGAFPTGALPILEPPARAFPTGGGAGGFPSLKGFSLPYIILASLPVICWSDQGKKRYYLPPSFLEHYDLTKISNIWNFFEKDACRDIFSCSFVGDLKEGKLQ